MRALILEGPAGEQPRLRLTHDQPEPSPGPGEALVHVLVAGVCATDLQLSQGYADFRGVLGHEFVGRVDAADDSALAGRRVVADINASCGVCPTCVAGHPHHCPHRRVLGIRGAPGAFAERLAVPRTNLVPVPDSVDDELAVFAEPLAAALHVLDELPRPWRDRSGGPPEPAIVIGDGKLGLLIAFALHGAGVPVRLIGRHADKLALVREHAGETSEALLEAQVDPQTHRSAFVVEASGSPSGLALALTLTRPRGTLALKTTLAHASPVDLSPVVVNELRVVGSRCGDMRAAIKCLAAGQADPRPLIRARHDLDQAERALIEAGRKGALKVLLRCAPASTGANG